MLFRSPTSNLALSNAHMIALRRSLPFADAPFALTALIAFVIGIAGSASIRGGEGAENGGTPEQREFFEKRIRPLLADRCWNCHGADQAEAELRLDSREAILEGGARGPAIVPGQPEKSLLVLAVNHADTLQMPPKEKLPLPEIADITRWIKEGAAWPGSTTVSSTPRSVRPAAADPDRKSTRLNSSHT